MRIALITTVPISLRFLRGHIQFLQRKDADVCVIASPGPILDAFAEELGVSAAGIEMRRAVSPFRDLVALWQLIRCLRSIRPDIVHAHTPKAGLLGMLAALIARVPVRLYHIHGLPLMTASGIKRVLLRACDAVACRLANQVFCVSGSIKQVVEGEKICSATKLVVLANGAIDGIDAEDAFNPNRFQSNGRAELRRSLNIPQNAKVVGFVGRIVEDKGICELLESFKLLVAEFPNLHLLVVGTFEDHQPIASASMTALRDDPRIHLIGYVDDPAPFYAVMDVLAFPTYREGFGLAAAEASAMELPVVATRIPGCVDAVRDGVTGTLVPPRDAQALAAAIASYLRDSDRCRRHGAAGRKRMLRDFQPGPIREALWRHYVSWMNAKQRRLRADPQSLLPLQKSA